MSLWSFIPSPRDPFAYFETANHNCARGTDFQTPGRPAFEEAGCTFGFPDGVKESGHRALFGRQ